MFEALFRKEWRQLRMLRWATIAIAAILPAAFVAGAEAARRGIAPLGALENYSRRELFAELLPAVVMLGLWPIAAVLAGAQAWTGDRASGAESFLLERPVRRGTIWRARLAAAAASFAVAATGAGAIALAAAAFAGATIERDAAGLAGYALGGLAAAALALCAVAAAATFVSSPLPALLLGLLLGAIPAVLSGFLGSAFPFASLSWAPIGAIAPWLLVPGFLGASVAGLCRGEPAGGGRARRAAIALGFALAAASIAFLAGAPAALAWNASPRRGIGGIEASPSGAGMAVATGRGGSWWRSFVVFDVSSGKRTATFPPPLQDLVWQPDGRRYAVLTFAGPLGSIRARMRIEFHELSGGRFARDVESDAEGWLWRGAWAGDELVALQSRELDPRRRGRSFDLLVVSPAAGTSVSVPLADDVLQCGVGGPLPDGTMIVAAAIAGDPGARDGGFASAAFRVWRFVPSEGRLGLHPVASGAGFPDFGIDSLVSPSGRYVSISRREAERNRPGVIELATGAWKPSGVSDEGLGRSWARDDTVVGVDHRRGGARLFAQTPDGAAEVIREWTGPGTRVAFHVSPDRRRVLVRVRRLPGDVPEPVREEPSAVWALEPRSRGEVPELAVYDLAASAWTRLDPATGETEDAWLGGVDWAGPDAIARSGRGWLAIEDLAHPGSRRVLFGREPPSR